MFSNAKLLTNIHEVPISLKILSTGGVSITNKIGMFKGYGWVWYHKKGIANILSLSRVKSKFRVTFDSSSDNSFHVHMTDGQSEDTKSWVENYIITTYARARVNLCMLTLLIIIKLSIHVKLTYAL